MLCFGDEKTHARSRIGEIISRLSATGAPAPPTRDADGRAARDQSSRLSQSRRVRNVNVACGTQLSPFQQNSTGTLARPASRVGPGTRARATARPRGARAHDARPDSRRRAPMRGAGGRGDRRQPSVCNCDRDRVSVRVSCVRVNMSCGLLCGLGSPPCRHHASTES